jgi:hypothetical protein
MDSKKEGTDSMGTVGPLFFYKKVGWGLNLQWGCCVKVENSEKTYETYERN